MAKLPNIKTFSAEIVARNRQNTKGSIRDSVTYIRDNVQDLRRFDNLYQLVLAIDDVQPDLKAKALAFHLLEVRQAIADGLLMRQIFIDSEILDEAVFFLAQTDDSDDLVGKVLRWLRDVGKPRAGLLVFPVHSLGILGAGLLRKEKRHLGFTDAKAGYSVHPQTNSFDRTIEVLDDARQRLGVAKPLPLDLLQHWKRSRPTSWLERNPLLVQRTVNMPGSYYGGQWMLISRLQATAGLLALVASLQPPTEPGVGPNFSTRIVNNQQTLDLHHYLNLFDASASGPLDGHCVPIHGGRSYITELSELAIDIDPRHWSRRPKTAERLSSATEALYSAYLRSRAATRMNSPDRVARQVTDSLSYFRRSHRRSVDDWSSVVSLATAFEMLLTDGYAPGVTNTLVRRSKHLLHGVPGTRAMQASIRDLYNARSKLVHTGDEGGEVDIHCARLAYVHCFLRIVERFSTVSPSTSTPFADLCADH